MTENPNQINPNALPTSIDALSRPPLEDGQPMIKEKEIFKIWL
jgi:hypothetical protein